jgi:hypothetical protein
MKLSKKAAKKPARKRPAPKKHHPRFDLAAWSKVFPLRSFERRSGPRRFHSSAPDDPIDLWKAQGRAINSPADMCCIEHVRKAAAAERDLGRKVPVDIFVWRAGAPAAPYLTKVGGIPHRERELEWPEDDEGNPATFVAQICFIDSLDIVPVRPPGDVMLLFLGGCDDDTFHPFEDYRIEWSSIALDEPMRAKDCPPAQLPVPQLAGEIHRTCEYPDARFTMRRERGRIVPGSDPFARNYKSWFFETTQSTKIGQTTHFIQGDGPAKGQHLLCTFNSIEPSERDRWPFVGLPRLPRNHECAHSAAFPDAPRSTGKYRIMFYDAGCMYFFIDKRGRVTLCGDCY